MTVRELINKSALLVGIVSSGESLTAEEANDGLVSLNDLLESWSTEGLLIYSTAIESFNLVAGQADYTMGTGGNFNTSRPQIIDAVSVVIAGSNPQQEIPLNIFNIQEWADQQGKNLQNRFPQSVYIDKEYPYVNMSFYPVPNQVNQVKIYSRKSLSSVATLDTSLSMPPGYNRALRYNLARELSNEYRKPLTQDVLDQAIELKAQLMRFNTDPVYLKSDADFLNQKRAWNWRTGDYK